jgi:hypothetical protein
MVRAGVDLTFTHLADAAGAASILAAASQKAVWANNSIAHFRIEFPRPLKHDASRLSCCPKADPPNVRQGSDVVEKGRLKR